MRWAAVAIYYYLRHTYDAFLAALFVACFQADADNITSEAHCCLRKHTPAPPQDIIYGWLSCRHSGYFVFILLFSAATLHTRWWHLARARLFAMPRRCALSAYAYICYYWRYADIFRYGYASAYYFSIYTASDIFTYIIYWCFILRYIDMFTLAMPADSAREQHYYDITPLRVTEDIFMIRRCSIRWYFDTPAMRKRRRALRYMAILRAAATGFSVIITPPHYATLCHYAAMAPRYAMPMATTCCCHITLSRLREDIDITILRCRHYLFITLLLMPDIIYLRRHYLHLFSFTPLCHYLPLMPLILLTLFSSRRHWQHYAWWCQRVDAFRLFSIAPYWAATPCCLRHMLILLYYYATMPFSLILMPPLFSLLFSRHYCAVFLIFSLYAHAFCHMMRYWYAICYYWRFADTRWCFIIIIAMMPAIFSFRDAFTLFRWYCHITLHIIFMPWCHTRTCHYYFSLILRHGAAAILLRHITRCHYYY